METYDPSVKCPECGVQADRLYIIEDGRQLCAQCSEDSQYEDDLFVPGLI